MPDHWTMGLFSRLKAVYRNQWSDLFKTQSELDDWLIEWGEALHGFTGDEIKTGIDGCRANLEWPPNIAQFIKQAKPPSGAGHNTAAYKKFAPVLPKPKSDGSAMEKFLSEFRQQHADSKHAEAVHRSKVDKGDGADSKANPATAMKEKISESLDTFCEGDNV